MNVSIKMNASKILVDRIKNVWILLAAIFAKQEVGYHEPAFSDRRESYRFKKHF